MKTLIQNGLLVDPANRIESKLNLLIEDGRVAQITQALPTANRVIDASGCIVCPGFIDIHMHEDPMGADGHIRYGIYEAMLRMGVTTAVGGNCGENVCDPAEYLNALDRDGAPVNAALFAGHGFLREQCGATDKYAGVLPEQMRALTRRIDAALEAGCVGVSFGLRYVPGTNGCELRKSAERCARLGRPVSVHLRDDAANIFSSVDEIAQVGQRLEIPVQISHIGSMGGFGQMERMLAQVDAWRAAGLDVSCDCYPYLAFSTRIGETTYDDGWLERYGCDYSACVPMEGKYKGMPCTQARFEELRRDFPDCITVCHVMREADVRMALTHPNVMIASDGLMDDGQGHPRAAGAFPRFFREYVHSGKLSLAEGIAKMTALPAARLGFARKGRLDPGTDADVVVFDPARFQDRASFEAPATPPEGVRAVLIGGELALKDGQIINARLGRALRA